MPKTNRAVMSATLGALALTFVGAGCTQTPAATGVTPPSTTGSVPTTSSYKDGTFTANGSYQSPADAEQITLQVTLSGGVVTDAVFTGHSGVQRSQHYMDIFASNYKPMVVGKNINDIHLTKVSGSSLTPIGFNSALEKIKQQAAQS